MAFTVDGDVHARLLALARTARVTPFMVVQAGLAVLLTGMGAGLISRSASPLPGALTRLFMILSDSS